MTRGLLIEAPRVVRSGTSRMEPMNKDKRPVSEVVERFWSDAEKNVEEAVKRALARVKFPRQTEIQALNTRLDALTRRLEALSK